MAFRFFDLILNKRNGKALSREEIRWWVQGHSRRQIPDEQVSALLMAIFFQGLDEAETLALTEEMIATGDTVDMTPLGDFTIDKHSTGGVGDKTSLVLGPVMAALELTVAKMSGRGLGHTGGTLDKLESFPGFQITLTPKEFKSQVKKIGLAIVGQSASLAPADKYLYALRDVTATIDSIPLIAASIMSKKLAVKNHGLILDVKFGSGAFMKSLPEAKKLARAMVDLGNGAGRKTIACLSTMNQPLGSAIGNGLEVREAIAALRGEGPADLHDLILECAGRGLILAGREKQLKEARARAERVLKSGQALEKLAQMVALQKGDADFVIHPERIPVARHQAEFPASMNGVIQSMDTEAIGKAAMLLGAGRERKEDTLDLTVGLEFLKKIGDRVKKGEPLARVYHNKKGLAESIAVLHQAVKIVAKPVPAEKLIHGWIN